MKKLLRFMLLVLVAWVVASLAQTIPDEQLLQALDDARFLQADSFAITVKVIAERTDGTTEALVKLSFKEIEGELYSRIEFLEPEELAGQVFLNTPDGTFFWTPDLAGPIKVTARQTVFGDASVSETAGIRFSNDYRITERREVQLDSGAAGLELDLEAQEESVPFQKGTVTVEAETLRPVRLRLFALSGDPLSEVTYLEYSDLEGDSYAKTQLVTNLLIPENRTSLDIVAASTEELPDELFNPASLGK